MYDNPSLKIGDTATIEKGQFSWRSPSNIALVKYWGKFGRQYPKNPSISFTLSQSHTDTHLKYQAKEKADDSIKLSFTFEGKENQLFANKIEKFLGAIQPIFPFLSQLDLEIESSNSFPHSSGIASSASSMSALALCLCSIENYLFGTLEDPSAFMKKASYIARLGSGSACRSVYADAAIWGASESIAQSSNDYAIPYEELHPVFKNYQDSILIVSKGEKAVSSRAGHALMNNHPFAEQRFQQAFENMDAILAALKSGDIERFGEILEEEAFSLHSMMLTSRPSFILMQPNTLAVIHRLRAYRKETKVPLYFTLDAGPNVHLLYPHDHKEAVQAFIESELKPYCEDQYLIHDQMGQGASTL